VVFTKIEQALGGLAARQIWRQRWIGCHQIGVPQDAQDGCHHQITGSEAIFKPIASAKLSF
jgi:hypothetical protein